MDFTVLKRTRRDATINFNWAAGSPDTLIEPDTFSVRWTGHVQPFYSEVYTFYVTADEGSRLWVNNQLLIDNWTNPVPTERSGTITLQAGQKYSIKLDYFENTGNANISLSWSSAKQPKMIIPKTQLYPVAFNLVTNPGFEADQTTVDVIKNWSSQSNQGQLDADGTWTPGSHSGTYYAYHWKAVPYHIWTYQRKTGLTNGMYTMKAWVRGSGGQTQAQMRAINYGGPGMSINIPATSTWTLITLANIPVSNGTCDFGFVSQAGADQWIDFDDVQFYLQ
jgi:hypothetical protein